MHQQHQQQQQQQQQHQHQQQQQQHLMQMQPMMAAYYPNTVTSDHIQQYLDENKSLILKIVESQNSGKLAECAENQARLQKNLMYLAAIADSQPQPPPMHSQFSSSGMMQSTSPYMQQQPYTTRSSIIYNSPQPYASLQQQYQALNSHQFGMNSTGSGVSGLHMMMQGGEATSSSGVTTPAVSYSHDFGRIDQSGGGGGVIKHEHWSSGGGGETSGGNSRGGGGDGMFMNNNSGGGGGGGDD